VNLFRYRVSGLDRNAVRAAAARTGFLVEDPQILRAGLGDVLETVSLPDGLRGAVNFTTAFARFTVLGENSPHCAGLVAFAALPFNRVSPSSFSLCTVTIVIDSTGDAWVTGPEGFDIWSVLDTCELPVQHTQVASSLTFNPSGDEYAHNVATAVEVLRSGSIEKVVLARSVRGTVDASIDPAAVAQRLKQREPLCTIYAMPLPDGQRFVGASPELLVSRHQGVARCHPLAGTIALPPHVAPDDYQKWLLGSGKNLHEHAVVANEVRSSLERFYEAVESDPTPSIMALRTVAHLGTWITGTSPRDASTSALDLVAALHPTAAVGGLPRDAAYRLITELETLDRGHYAGPVGWIDGNGDGEFWIGIRGVQLYDNHFVAWAGAGIVSESDPIAEREETRDKLASVLAAVLVDRI